MSGTPKRISLNELEESLRQSLQDNLTIIPVNYSYVEAGTNPDDHKFVRITDGQYRNNVYIWRYDTEQWELIGADDTEIFWSEIKEKPTQFNPSPHQHQEEDLTIDKYTQAEVDNLLTQKSDVGHGHAELHSHNNKSILDTITQILINAWNSAVDHISDAIKHITSEERALWNTVSNKSDQGHLHDGRYYTKSETDSALSGKANTFSNRAVLEKITEVISNDSYDLSLIPDHEDRLWAIENGYTEGHTHDNLDVLNELSDDGNDGLLYKGQEISGGVSDYNELINVPTEFPPKAHVHVKAEITDFEHTHDLVYATINHNHDGTYQPIGNYSVEGHNHDGRYYQKSEFDTALAGKSDINHVHTISNVTNLQSSLNGKSDVGHVHSVEDISDMPDFPEGDFRDYGLGTTGNTVSLLSDLVETQFFSHSTGDAPPDAPVKAQSLGIHMRNAWGRVQITCPNTGASIGKIFIRASNSTEGTTGWTEWKELTSISVGTSHNNADIWYKEV